MTLWCRMKSCGGLKSEIGTNCGAAFSGRGPAFQRVQPAGRPAAGTIARPTTLAERLGIACIALILLAGCGYHVTGRGEMLPKTMKTIAIPAFGNVTPRQTLARLLAADTAREFISRTRYRIVDDPNQADAVLHGTLTNFDVNPIIFDPVSGRATTVHVRATVQILLIDRVTGKTIFSRPNLQWDERYQVSNNVQEYFDESSTAIQRIGQSMARTVVSAVLENF